MKPSIIKPDNSKEIFTSEKCLILETVNAPDDEMLSLARARVKPGTTTVWHVLDGIDERYLIISGKGRVEIGEIASTVGPGDLVLIPRETRQRITNVGKDDLVFYCICTPGFRPDRYRQIGE